MSDDLLDVIAAAVGRIEATVNKTATRVDAIETRLRSFERDLTDVKNSVVLIARRIDNHENRIRAIENS